MYCTYMKQWVLPVMLQSRPSLPRGMKSTTVCLWMSLFTCNYGGDYRIFSLLAGQLWYNLSAPGGGGPHTGPAPRPPSPPLQHPTTFFPYNLLYLSHCMTLSLPTRPISCSFHSVYTSRSLVSSFTFPIPILPVYLYPSNLWPSHSPAFLLFIFSYPYPSFLF